MQLKQYQKDTLDVLRRFLRDARIVGSKRAYETITKEPGITDRLGRYASDYSEAFKDLSDVPYVCLRLPTGGGKTLLASHAVRVARDAWIDKDWPLVLWLVPTKTIRRQTVEALKDTRHSYRQVLDKEFDGRVRVFDISDFSHIRPMDLRQNCTIVVGTIQTLRITNTEGRKAYSHNEHLEPHFRSLPRLPAQLESTEAGSPKFSFANLMHLHRPIMIVDEAHNAVTGLTREMQARLRPSAIIEFTATPRRKSNILYSVSAQELKSEDMIKLPIVLSENDSWESAVTGAIAKRAELAGVVDGSGESEYIRPIVLFQAQTKNREVNVTALRDHLVHTERIPENQIALATGDQRGLDGLDLFDPRCTVNYVITVEALREGWDCSFAYVFCSLSRIQSARNVEQLFGRVLRMPYARRRQSVELNQAYAYVSEPSFGQAATALVDKLVKMGFEEDEAIDSIQQEFPEFADLGSADGQGSLLNRLKPSFRHDVPASSELITALDELSNDRISVTRAREDTEETVSIVVIGAIDPRVEDALTQSLPREHREEFSRAVDKYMTDNRHLLSPAERGDLLMVPRLVAELQGRFELADPETFMEHHVWSILSHPARFDDHDFSVREMAHHFQIDIDGKRIRHHFLNEYEQSSLSFGMEGWTPENLVIWLDQQVHQPDINQIDLLKWLSDLVQHLNVYRGHDISLLTRCKYLLASKVESTIAVIRQQERKRAYQHFLFDPSARVAVTFDSAFEFRDGMYKDRPRYRGHWKPTKHFLGPDQLPAFDGLEDGEEVQCAQAIDSLSEVKYWIRNVARHRNSLWLPTANDRFYPDFVALLTDGRHLVAEYKGAHIAEGSDTAEKRTIGALWERWSEGKGLFIMVEKYTDGLDMRTQLQQKVAST